MEKIIKEENNWDHVVEADVVEEPVSNKYLTRRW